MAIYKGIYSKLHGDVARDEKFSVIRATMLHCWTHWTWLRKHCIKLIRLPLNSSPMSNGLSTLLGRPASFFNWLVIPVNLLFMSVFPSIVKPLAFHDFSRSVNDYLLLHRESISFQRGRCSVPETKYAPLLQWKWYIFYTFFRLSLAASPLLQSLCSCHLRNLILDITYCLLSLQLVILLELCYLS